MSDHTNEQKYMKKYKKLSMIDIDSSEQIQSWVKQFPLADQIIAKKMLSQITFISKDTYSDWFRKTLNKLDPNKNYALYAVRKLKEKEMIWDQSGLLALRKGSPQGSEDLIGLEIRNAAKAAEKKLMNHPSLIDLRDQKIHNIILVEDSIGSGGRMRIFINRMLQHPTFLSWWNLGYIKIHIFSFSRSLESKAEIVPKIRGSDHSNRKYPKSSKFIFFSEIIYSSDQLTRRWGQQSQEILNLCTNTRAIKKKWRKGFGKVMANIVFYHSVPNNIPGVFYVKNDNWSPLFPNRTLPDWALDLLNKSTNMAIPTNKSDSVISIDILDLLVLLKSGLRKKSSLGLRLNYDEIIVENLLTKAQEMSFISDVNRLTPAGLDFIKKHQSIQKTLPIWDRSMYIPKTWCTGRSSI